MPNNTEDSILYAAGEFAQTDSYGGSEFLATKKKTFTSQ